MRNARHPLEVYGRPKHKSPKAPRTHRRHPPGFRRPQTKPKRAWTTPAAANEEAVNVLRPSGTAALSQSCPVSPGQHPRDPQQISKWRASAQPSSNPKKAWTPDPQQSGSGAGQRTNARYITTKSARDTHAGQGRLHRQSPGGLPPAHTGPAKTQIEYEPHPTTRTLAQPWKPKTPTNARAMPGRKAARPSQGGTQRPDTERKAKGERTLPSQPTGDRLTTKKTDYTSGLKWPAILTTKG